MGRGREGRWGRGGGEVGGGGELGGGGEVGGRWGGGGEGGWGEAYSHESWSRCMGSVSLCYRPMMRDYFRGSEDFQPHPSGSATKNERGEVDIVVEGTFVIAPLLFLRTIVKMPCHQVRVVTKLLAQDRDCVTQEIHETWCTLLVILQWDNYAAECGPRMHYFLSVTKPVLIEDVGGHPVLSNQWDFSTVFQKRFARGRARTIVVEARRYAPVPDYVLGWIAMSGAAKFRLSAENLRRSREGGTQQRADDETPDGHRTLCPRPKESPPDDFQPQTDEAFLSISAGSGSLHHLNHSSSSSGSGAMSSSSAAMPAHSSTSTARSRVVQQMMSALPLVRSPASGPADDVRSTARPLVQQMMSARQHIYRSTARPLVGESDPPAQQMMSPQYNSNGSLLNASFLDTSLLTREVQLRPNQSSSEPVSVGRLCPRPNQSSSDDSSGENGSFDVDSGDALALQLFEDEERDREDE